MSGSLTDHGGEQQGPASEEVRTAASERTDADDHGPVEDGAGGNQEAREAEPAPRPRRRRRTKPQIETDEASSESAAVEAPSDGGGSPEVRGAQTSSVDGADDAAPAQDVLAEQPQDVRPGRSRRTHEEPEGADSTGGESAPETTAPAGTSEKGARQQGPQQQNGQHGSQQAGQQQNPQQQGNQQQGGQQPRRTHQNRKNEGGRQQHGGSNQGGGQGGQGNQGGQNQNQNNQNGGQQGSRGNNRQQNSHSGRNNRNNRNAPTEPTLKREELQAMKVAELREKARELDIETTGKRKAELVDEVYTTAARREGFRDIEGVLDITNEGYGYIRAHGYMPSKDDAFVAASLIRAAGLRPGDLVSGALRPSRQGDKYPGLAKIYTVNGLDPEQIKGRPKFADLTPIYPNEPLKMEHGKDSITGRAIDIVAPVGKGQRGLIVSPPKAGKTTVLKHICQSIAINNPEVHVICLLVDERPEEVTDMQRSIQGEVVASTFDMPAENHTRVSELVIERAKRIVELGGDVVVVLDSITRLARAYNLAAPASGRILSGGVDSAALYPPKRFLGAARNIENGGSLTILASALVDTGSKMDEVIFEEFKGTGNMELKLDRDLADRRIFPAIDPVASGTRNEELLLDENMKPFIWGIRRVLANMNSTERAAASFIKGLKSTNSNQEFLIRSAKKAQDYPDAV